MTLSNILREIMAVLFIACFKFFQPIKGELDPRFEPVCFDWHRLHSRLWCNSFYPIHSHFNSHCDPSATRTLHLTQKKKREREKKWMITLIAPDILTFVIKPSSLQGHLSYWQENVLMKSIYEGSSEICVWLLKLPSPYLQILGRISCNSWRQMCSFHRSLSWKLYMYGC